MTNLTAHDMRVVLYRHYVSQAAVLFEISANSQLEPGEHPKYPGVANYRRRIVDVLTIKRARRKGIGPLDLMAIEIKVARSDFLADVKDPRKQAAWREIAHRHAYAVPEGLVRPDEIPDGSGLIVVKSYDHSGGHCAEWARKAPYTATPEVPVWMMLSLAWRMSAAEAKVRGIAHETRDMSDSPEDLRAALVKARADIDKLEGRATRAENLAVAWRSAYAVCGHLPCGTCGQPIKPRVDRGYLSGWVHVRQQDEGPCSEKRGSYWNPVGPAEDAEPPGTERGAA